MGARRAQSGTEDAVSTIFLLYDCCHFISGALFDVMFDFLCLSRRLSIYVGEGWPSEII